MERIENEVHQTLQDLDAYGGLLPPVDNTNEGSSETTTTFQQQQDHRRQHTLRRLLRRLDRSLLQLEQQLNTTPHHINNADNHSSSRNPPVISQSLLTILTRLPVNDDNDESSLEICLSIQNTVARLWTKHDDYFHSMLDPNDVRILLRRIVQRAAAGPLPSPQDNNNNNNNNNNSPYLICAPWLKVVNLHLSANMNCTANKQQHQVITTTTKADKRWLLVLGPIMRVALHSFWTIRTWHVQRIQDPETEAVLQWRHLTSLLMVQLVQQQQQQPSSSTSSCSALEWLEQNFSAIMHTNTSHEDDDNYNDNDGDPMAVVRRRAAARDAAQELMEQFQTFAAELVEFVLDALDGAAAVDVSSSSSDNNNNTAIPSDEGESAMMAQRTKTYAIRDAFRHLAVTLRVLQTLNEWSLVRREWPLKLWKSLATAFVSPTTTRGSSPDDGSVARDFGGTICHFTLTVAEMVLQFDSSSENQIPTTTLAMTFLRSLEYPDRLLAVDCFWSALKENASPSNELRHVLQVAVLTLQQSLGNNGHIGAYSLSASSSDASSTQALIQRIVQVLPEEESSTSQKGTTFRQDDAWDTFFWNRFNDAAR